VSRRRKSCRNCRTAPTCGNAGRCVRSFVYRLKCRWARCVLKQIGTGRIDSATRQRLADSERRSTTGEAPRSPCASCNDSTASDKEKIRKNRGALALGLRELHMPEKQVRAEFTGVHWSGEPLWTLFDLDKPLITGTIDDVEQHLAELSDETGEGTTIEHPDGDVWVMSH
jgi:hypothetical protein